jgi:hypothetical protein
VSLPYIFLYTILAFVSYRSIEPTSRPIWVVLRYMYILMASDALVYLAFPKEGLISIEPIFEVQPMLYKYISLL